jgi:SET domain-containing protein
MVQVQGIHCCCCCCLFADPFAFPSDETAATKSTTTTPQTMGGRQFAATGVPHLASSTEKGKSEDMYEVRPSPGRGRGLFAKVLIRAYQFIIEYVGERIDGGEHHRRYPDVAHRGNYVLGINNNLFIDAADEKLSNLSRFLNTAGKGGETNNATVNVSYPEKGVPHVAIRAKRDIQPGEEIFIPYGPGFHFEEPPPRRSSRLDPCAYVMCHCAPCCMD